MLKEILNSAKAKIALDRMLLGKYIEEKMTYSLFIQVDLRTY